MCALSELSLHSHCACHKTHHLLNTDSESLPLRSRPNAEVEARALSGPQQQSLKRSLEVRNGAHTTLIARAMIALKLYPAKVLKKFIGKSIANSHKNFWAKGTAPAPPAGGASPPASPVSYSGSLTLV